MEAKTETKAETKPETRKIVRFMETDIDGAVPLGRALRRIKGMSFMFSNAVCIMTNSDPKRKIGLLSIDELKSLEQAIRNLPFPSWMLNRRKDLDMGKDRHLFGNELQLTWREDINLMRRIRAYRGIRHEMGQPVRGQRTRSSFRTQSSVGVSKKKQEPAKAAAPSAAPAASKAAPKK